MRSPLTVPVSPVSLNCAIFSNDPFHGVRLGKSKLILPKAPGLGLTAAK